MDPRTWPACGAAFVPRSGNQKYCTAACAAKINHSKNLPDETIKAFRAKRRAEEKRECAAREARLKRRDAAYAANAPRTTVVTRGKIKVELRGTVPVAPWQPKNELRVQRPGGFGWAHIFNSHDSQFA